MEWILLALLASALMAFQVEYNRYFAYDGLTLNFYRGLCGSLLLLPLVFLVPWPAQPALYFVAAVDGIGSVVAQRILFDLAARKQSRVSSLYSPLATLVALVMWFCLSASERARIFAAPEAGLLLLLALGAAAYGLNRLRRNDASLAAFIAVLPVGILYGATDVLARLVIDADALLAGVIVYAFVSFLVMTVTNFFVLGPRQVIQARPTAEFWRVAATLATAAVIFQMLFTVALVWAPNPAYPGFLIMMMPALLLAYHHLRGIKDEADWRAALVIVAGACLAALQSVIYSG